MHVYKRTLSLVVLTFLFFLGLLTPPQSCRADTVDSGPLNFQTTGQSMWNSGQAALVNYQIFNVDQPVSVNDTIGSISTTCISFLGTCYPTGSYGVQINANINGHIGANMNLTLTGGDVNAAVPVNVTLGFPGTVANNTPFNITSSGLFQPGASLASESPGALLKLDVSANLSGGITGEACLGGCGATVGPTFNINGTKNLFTTNLVADLVGKTFPISPYFFATAAAAPYVGTSATTTAQADAATPLTLSSSAVATSSFLSINADISNAIAAAFGMAPLDGSVPLGGTSLSYDLFKFSAGVGLNSTQAFTLSATPEVGYIINEIGSNPQTLFSGNMPVGTPYSFSIPTGDTAADVTPQYLMMANLTNETGVVPAINFDFSALGLKYAGLGIPHLLDLPFSIPLNGLNVNFVDQTFPLLGWNTIQGTPFEITATNPTAAVPEPPTLFLVGAGFLLMAGLLRRLNHARAIGHQG